MSQSAYPPVNDPLFTNAQAAEYLGIKPTTLDVWRCTKRYKISYIKVGRLVRYPKSALDSFLDRRKVDDESGAWQ